MPQEIANKGKTNPYIDPQWPGKTFRKIDAFAHGVYLGSSNAYRTLADAKNGFAFRSGYDPKVIITAYSDGK